MCRRRVNDGLVFTNLLGSRMIFIDFLTGKTQKYHTSYPNIVVYTYSVEHNKMYFRSIWHVMHGASHRMFGMITEVISVQESMVRQNGSTIRRLLGHIGIILSSLSESECLLIVII